jgi:TonB-dependent SusC/RagA subfamily outer membrane receptor
MQTRRTGVLAVVLSGGLIAFSTGCGAHSSVPQRGLEAERVQLGYGSEDREDVTGSFSSVTAANFAQSRDTQIEEMLARLPGVQVLRQGGGNFSVRIRGSRSLVGSNEPLVVINGSPVSAARASDALMGIVPGNVTRIDVLKDAGLTAAYGARGANGVIVVTTTRAR